MSSQSSLNSEKCSKNSQNGEASLVLPRFNEPDEVYANQELREKAHSICREYLGGVWKKVSTRDLTIKSVMGGLSNMLYYCAIKNDNYELVADEPRRVLLRIYGQDRDDAQDALVAESVIATLLSERGVGPKLYAVFATGRLEELIQASALTSDQVRLPHLSPAIARKLGRLHAICAPLSKEPTFIAENMARWFEKVTTEPLGLKLPDTGVFKNLSLEIVWMNQAAHNSDSPVVFCHNDLQGGNILYKSNQHHRGSLARKPSETENKMTFIDFEYSGYNYRGFDIANHFCEWTFDYTYPDPPYFLIHQNLYPSVKQQLDYIDVYLEGFRSAEQRHMSEKYYNPKKILHEIELFTVASHLLWALWSLFNARTSKIKFDYVEYAKKRLEIYFELKKQLLSRLEKGKQ